MERQNNATRRVLVVENGSLLDEGVKSLLRRKTALKVSGVTYADEATLLKDISQLSPDVIVLNEAGPVDSVQICKLLKSLSAPTAWCVIVVRPDDNRIDLYKKQSVIASKSNDLIALIQAQ